MRKSKRSTSSYRPLMPTVTVRFRSLSIWPSSETCSNLLLVRDSSERERVQALPKPKQLYLKSCSNLARFEALLKLITSFFSTKKIKMRQAGIRIAFLWPRTDSQVMNLLPRSNFCLQINSHNPLLFFALLRSYFLYYS